MNKDYLGKVTTYKLIGSGAYSDVYECDYNGAYSAYKKYRNESYAQMVTNNIIKLTELYEDKEFLFPHKTIYYSPKDTVLKGYVMDYLYQYKELQDIKNIDKIKILLKSRELLEKFHNKYNRVHTDICPWNYLYNQEKNNLKLTDFDTSIDLRKKEIGDLNQYNPYAADYIEKIGIDKDLDIFLFNLYTYSILTDVDYTTILKYIEVTKIELSSSKACSILESYRDLNKKTLKKEYIIDYIK